MGKILSTLLGLGIIGYMMYVLVLALQIILGAGSNTWQGISIHLILAGIILAVVLVGHFWDNSHEKQADAETSPLQTSDSISEAPVKPIYNPNVDRLHFGVYQQAFKTWWYDSDGDTHEEGTLYANLRFYKDGTVIAIRSLNIPKIEVLDSFTMKGSYAVEENQLTFSLKKNTDTDDSITIDISEEDRRNMKYYGEIADDNSLIKAGTYTGSVQENTLSTGNFTFSKLAIAKLIVTAAESTCELLEQRIKAHPYIVDTFQDTGNWYTNGETGPEWFTLHIETAQGWEKEVETLVNTELQHLNKAASNLFWQ